MENTARKLMVRAEAVLREINRLADIGSSKCDILRCCNFVTLREKERKRKKK